MALKFRQSILYGPISCGKLSIRYNINYIYYVINIIYIRRIRVEKSDRIKQYTLSLNVDVSIDIFISTKIAKIPGLLKYPMYNGVTRDVT